MLLHSDIARLVLGYLAEENCSQSYQSFLNESIHLKSVRHSFAKETSDTAPVTIFGQSLCRIIDEYYNMKDAEMQIWNIKNRRCRKNLKFLAMWKKLEEAISSVKSFQVASILDGLQMNKSYCKNCESTMTRSGVVMTPSTPADMIYHNNTVRKTMKKNLYQEVVPPPLEVSNSSISSASGEELGNISEKNRRKKTRSAPKKLSDTERKDKETELSTDPSSLLLHNITGSGAMAVVGATIMTQMKKCAQSEKATCSVTPSTKFDVDANAAKHNQESIAQLSLQSLLSSDFNIDGMEFGRELEELLGIQDEEALNVQGVAMSAQECEKSESQQITEMNFSAMDVMSSEQVVEISASPSVDSPLKIIPQTVDIVEPPEIEKPDAAAVPDVFASEVEVVTTVPANALGPEVNFGESEKELISVARTPTNKMFEPKPTEDISILTSKGSALKCQFGKRVYSTRSDDNEPTDKLKKERFFLGKPVVVRVSNNLSNRRSPKSDIPADKKPNHDFNNSDSNNLNSKKDISTNRATADADVIVSSQIAEVVAPKTNESEMEKQLQIATPSRDVDTDEPEALDESVKFSSVFESDVSFLQSPKKTSVALKKSKEFDEQCASVETNPIHCRTPKKSFQPFVTDESPAKNTRSKMKPSKKTPKIVIKSNSEKKRSKARKKKKERDAKKNVKNRSKLKQTSTEAECVEDEQLSDIPSDSPKNILTAVKLQSTTSSPRKLTLRYGLRATQVSNLTSEKETSFPAPSASKSTSCDSATLLNELKDDLFDNLLADSRVSVERVDDKVDCTPGDLMELNTLTSLATPAPSSEISAVLSSAIAAESPRIANLKSSASVIVPDDANVEMDVIMMQLVEQVRQSKTTSHPPSPYSASKVITNTHQDPIDSCSDPHHSSFTPTRLSATPAGRKIIEASTPSIESKCQRNVTGDSLTELLNETSLTQLVEAVRSSGDSDWVCDPTPVFDKTNSVDFKTISPSAGIFSCFSEPQIELPPSAQQTVTASGADILSEAAVSAELPILSSIVATPIPTPKSVVFEPVATCLTETEIATENLRAWLTGNTGTPAVRSGRRRATVARKYDFASPGIYRNIPKSGGRSKVFTKRQRKLLPKPDSRFSPILPRTSKTSTCATVAVLDDLPLQNKSVAFSTRATSEIIGSTAPVIDSIASDHPSLHLPSMPISTPVETSTTCQPQFSLSAVDVIDSLDVAVAANEVVTSIDSVPVVPQSHVSTITESKLDPSLSLTDSSSRDITLTTFTRQSPMPSVKPITPPEELSTEKLSPVKPSLTAISHSQTPSKTPDPVKSPTSLPSVEEKTTIKSSPESRPDRRKSTSIRDSSEEHSLRIVTSDEDRRGIFTSPTSRKRKLSRKLTPQKKPRLEKFASSSTSDLVAFLKKIHGQGESALQDSFEKRKKEKHPKHRLSDPVTIQNRLEAAYLSPSRSSPRRKSFDKDRATSNLKTSSSKSPSRSRDDPHRRSKKKTPKKTEKAKRRVSLTTVPIPPSKLGGSPMHLRTPSPVLVCRDSPNTIALVAESLVELSRSRSSLPESPLASPRIPSEKLTSGTSPALSKSGKSSSGKESSRKKKKKTKKRLSLEDINISEFLSTINYD